MFIELIVLLYIFIELIVLLYIFIVLLYIFIELIVLLYIFIELIVLLYIFIVLIVLLYTFNNYGDKKKSAHSEARRFPPCSLLQVSITEALFYFSRTLCASLEYVFVPSAVSTK